MKKRMTNVRVYGLSESLVASGYPMLSEPLTEKEFEERVKRTRCNLDAYLCTSGSDDVLTEDKNVKRGVLLGNTEKGAGDDNYLNGIVVQFDLTLSDKCWVEAQRYHFLDFVSSTSKQHRIAKMNLDNCFNDYADEHIKETVKELVEQYKADPTPEKYLKLLYNVPSGFEMTARMTTNYRQLKTIWCQRHTHRLPEWRQFCTEIEKLPMFKELCLKKYKEKEVKKEN